MFFNIIVHVGGIVRTCLRRIARAPLAPDAILDEIPGFRHANMSVNVNDLHAPATDDDLARLSFGDGLCGRLAWFQRKTK
jgi:hypothetical protein